MPTSQVIRCETYFQIFTKRRSRNFYNTSTITASQKYMIGHQSIIVSSPLASFAFKAKSKCLMVAYSAQCHLYVLSLWTYYILCHFPPHWIWATLLAFFCSSTQGGPETSIIFWSVMLLLQRSVWISLAIASSPGTWPDRHV